MPAVLGVLALSGACKADLPTITDANQGLDAACSGPFADLLVDVFPTSLANGDAVLGAPDGMAVTLMANHIVTVGFIGLGGVTDASGTDLKIHATVASGASAIVHVAASEMEFRYAGDLTPMINEVDVAVSDFTSAIYVRVINVTGTITVDSIEATHDACR
ncbi:MAG: hypothetical protein H0T89_33900 [Deltaproteobacteria bacterium]|nr:hypothetical protein [Deltaproteobacteria bacterium]MDQ3297886.1 hypothetical protein [Myxococcota bacterium]